MDRRYSVLLASGQRKIAPGGQFGLHVVAIDELAFYIRGGSKEERTELTETLRDLISRGRAAGMIVIAATQKPSNDIIPTFVRDLFSFRMALRCTTPEASDTILGQGLGLPGLLSGHLGSNDPWRRLSARRRLSAGEAAHPLPRRRRRRRTRSTGRPSEEPVVTTASYWRSVLSEVDRAGLCANPIRLRGMTSGPIHRRAD